MSEQPSLNSQIKHSEASLLDLWLIAMKHRKTFFTLFTLTLVCVLFLASLTPAVYTVTSTIEIGNMTQHGDRVPIESPETVKAKLEKALGPSVMAENGGKWLASDFSVSIPKGSKLVLVQSLTESDAVNTTKELHEKLIARLVKDHEHIQQVDRTQLKAEIAAANEHLNRLTDKRLQQPKRITHEAQAQDAKAALTLLTDPTILSYQEKELDIQINTEREKLNSLMGQEVLLKKRAVHLKKSKELLTRQIHELNQHIEQDAELGTILTDEDYKNSQVPAILIANNEFQRNRYFRLAKLEERLFVELESDESTLQRDIDENKRAQNHQTDIIAHREKLKEKLQIENHLKKERVSIDIARAEANLAEMDALHEQQLALGKLAITELQAKLDSLVRTHAVAIPLRSQLPSNISMKVIVLFSALLGIMLGIIGIFTQAFVEKLRINQNTD